MSTKIWSFQSNPFETHTRNSNRKMFTVATDTRSKLQAEIADADIAVMFNNLDPVFQAYVLIYTNYSVVFGERKGKTLNLKNLLKQMQDVELPKWEGLIHAIYPKGTPAEVEIFPNSRTPFLHGTYEERINAVHVLQQKTGADPTLIMVTPLISSHYNLLITARDTQQQKEGLKGQLSASRESQRLLLADQLYKVLGGIMVKFASNRGQIPHYFDLSLLRDTGGDDLLFEVENVVAASATNNEDNIPDGAKRAVIELFLGGPVEFGISQDGTTFIGTPVTISVPGKVEFTIGEMQPGTNIILVKNLNTTDVGAYRIEIFG